MSANSNDEYNASETKRRMDDALRRALTTPHKPNQAFVGKKAKPESGESPKKAKRISRGRAKPKAVLRAKKKAR
jgi:hypothetical protein